MTYTYAILDVSQRSFDEIARKLRDADYHHAFDRDVIDMHGIALRGDDRSRTHDPETRHCTRCNEPDPYHLRTCIHYEYGKAQP